MWVFQGERRRGTKSIRARVRARENHMKPFVRTSFLSTRPSCLPSPGETTFRHGRPKAHFMTGPHRQPSNYVKETKTVLGSEFPIVDSRHPGTGYQMPDFLSLEIGFRNPIVSGIPVFLSSFPNSKAYTIPDSTSKNFSGFWNPDFLT